MNGFTSYEGVDPRGRVDVMAVRAAEVVARAFERETGAPVWEILRPHAERIAAKHLGPRTKKRRRPCQR